MVSLDIVSLSSNTFRANWSTTVRRVAPAKLVYKTKQRKCSILNDSPHSKHIAKYMWEREREGSRKQTPEDFENALQLL